MSPFDPKYAHMTDAELTQAMENSSATQQNRTEVRHAAARLAFEYIRRGLPLGLITTWYMRVLLGGASIWIHHPLAVLDVPGDPLVGDARGLTDANHHPVLFCWDHFNPLLIRSRHSNAVEYHYTLDEIIPYSVHNAELVNTPRSPKPLRRGPRVWYP